MTRRSSGPTSSAASSTSTRRLLTDPVVRRADGSWLYLLPSVIDDVDLGVTHIVRGEDHVSNSATQIQMFAALGAEPPQFAHEALLVAAEGKLSKRLGSYGVEHLREEGVEPMALTVAAGAHRHVAAGRAARQPRRAGGGLRLRPFRPRARAFRPRTTSNCSMPACCTISTSRPLPTAFPPARREADWLLLRGNLSAWSDIRAWRAVLDGDDRAARAQPRRPRFRARGGFGRRRARLGRRAMARADRGAEGLDRPQGPSAVHAASPRADRA